MSAVDTIMNWFRRGGIMSSGSLTNITDHPRIGIDTREYDRIHENLKYFEGRFRPVVYKNVYGEDIQRPYVHLNMAQVSVRRLSSIIFNEQMTFEIAKNETANKYVHDVLANNDFIKNFERYLESALALGGLAMRPYTDKGQVKIAYIQAPVFFPLHSNVNSVSEAAIATKSVTVEGQRNVYWTLLEFHSWNGDNYVIENELYRSNEANVVGKLVPLQSNKTYANLESRTVFEGLSRPQFVYLKPFGMNNKDISSPLGLSIFDNAHTTLKQINDTYDQFNWEIRMGRRKVAVPKDMVKVNIDENGKFTRTFDPEEGVYISTGTTSEDGRIQDMTSDIRSDSYITSINQFIKTYELQTGLSAGTFSFDAQGLKTATEVVSENSMTYQTRNSHLNNVERAIQELIISILELAKATGLFVGEIPALDDVNLNFDDGVFTDKAAQLDYYSKAVAAGLQSKQRAIMKILNVDEVEAMKVIAEIEDESAGPKQPVDDLAYSGKTEE